MPLLSYLGCCKHNLLLFSFEMPLPPPPPPPPPLPTTEQKQATQQQSTPPSCIPTYIGMDVPNMRCFSKPKSRRGDPTWHAMTAMVVGDYFSSPFFCRDLPWNFSTNGRTRISQEYLHPILGTKLFLRTHAINALQVNRNSRMSSTTPCAKISQICAISASLLPRTFFHTGKEIKSFEIFFRPSFMNDFSGKMRDREKRGASWICSSVELRR